MLKSGWVKFGLVLVAIAMLGGAVYWVNSELEEMKAAAKQEGRREAQLEVARRDNQALVALHKRLEELKVLLQKKEADHAAAIAELDKKKTREVADAEARKEKFVSDVVAGRVRLFDPGRRADACRPDGGGGAAATARAAAGVGDGAGGSELSPAFAEFLGREAGRADKVVLKLQTCQKIIEEDRKVCR